MKLASCWHVVHWVRGPPGCGRWYRTGHRLPRCRCAGALCSVTRLLAHRCFSGVTPGCGFGAVCLLPVTADCCPNWPCHLPSRSRSSGGSAPPSPPAEWLTGSARASPRRPGAGSHGHGHAYRLPAWEQPVSLLSGWSLSRSVGALYTSRRPALRRLICDKYRWWRLCSCFLGRMLVIRNSQFGYSRVYFFLFFSSRKALLVFQEIVSSLQNRHVLSFKGGQVHPPPPWSVQLRTVA